MCVCAVCVCVCVVCVCVCAVCVCPMCVCVCVWCVCVCVCAVVHLCLNLHDFVRKPVLMYVLSNLLPSRSSGYEES